MTITEATRYAKEMGKDLPRWQEQIASYENKGYYIHFSNVPRVGLYLVNKYNTPIGFYAYPLDRNKMADFATDRPYAIIIKPKTEMKLLELKTYSESDLKADIAKLEKLGYSKKVMDKAIKEARNKTPGGKIWNITRILSIVPEPEINEAQSETVRGGGPTGKWTMLIKKLGYDGVNDDCLSIIHPSEKCQAVFFDTSKLDLVKIIDKSEKPVFGGDPLGIGMGEGEIKGLGFDAEKLDRTLGMLNKKGQKKQIIDTILANRSTPTAVLNVILKHSKADEVNVLNHPNAPPEVFKKFATDKRTWLRRTVAANQGAPVEVLDMLAKDKDAFIRELVAENPKTRKETLIVLANDIVASVNNGVARNRNAPVELLNALAKKHPNAVASNPSTPVEMLIAFSKSKDPSIQQKIASNPSTPVEILIAFSKSKQSDIRKEIASNPTTPIEVLKTLKQDKDWRVSSIASEELKKRNLAESLLNKVLTKLLYL